MSLQAALMVSLIWKYYSVPVAVVPSKWITPLDRLVAFPTRVAGEGSGKRGGGAWLRLKWDVCSQVTSPCRLV